MSSFLSNWHTSKDRVISIRYLLDAKAMFIIFLVWWIWLWNIEPLFKPFHWSYNCLIYKPLFLPLYYVVICCVTLSCYIFCCVVLCCRILICIVQCCFISFHILHYYVLLYLCCDMLYYFVLFSVVLHCFLLLYFMLCCFELIYIVFMPF